MGTEALPRSIAWYRQAMWHAWREEECIKGFGGKGRRKETTRLPMYGLDNSMRMDLREIGWGRIKSIHLAQDRGQWRDLVTAVMNFRAEKMLRYSWVNERLAASQQELNSWSWLVISRVVSQSGKTAILEIRRWSVPTATRVQESRRMRSRSWELARRGHMKAWCRNSWHVFLTEIRRLHWRTLTLKGTYICMKRKAVKYSISNYSSKSRFYVVTSSTKRYFLFEK
jgi:hypothetical protein